MIRTLFIYLLLSGCTAPVQTVKLENRSREVTIHIVDKIPKNPQLLGLTHCNQAHCTVWVREKNYPGCLLHELRHVFEGEWHVGPSTEYCERRS